MIGRRVVIALAVAGACFTGSAYAQGLGTVAAREKAKRAESKAKKPEAKVFTNTELEQGRPPGWKKDESAGASASSETSSESSPTENTQPRTLTTSERAEGERSFVEAITQAQQGVSAAEGRVRQLQEKLNPMSVAYIYGAGGSNDANEELRVRQELTQAEAELQSARQQLGTANKGLQDVRQGRSPSPPVQR
ncbi:MAG: hypothetical protein ACHQM7_00775 [Vicinamibacterales bacterium]